MHQTQSEYRSTGSLTRYLRGERHRQATDSEARNDGAHLHPDLVEEREQAREDGDGPVVCVCVGIIVRMNV